VRVGSAVEFDDSADVLARQRRIRGADRDRSFLPTPRNRNSDLTRADGLEPPGCVRPFLHHKSKSGPRRRTIGLKAPDRSAVVLRELLTRPAFEVVGVKAYSENKYGVDVGTLACLDPIGVSASTRREDVLALEADCVLRSGKNLD